ncbi:hypothetical protein ACQ86N_30105 [Puia sp. P3]|uniref:hypothetical protein n=1 Tax=Puia sp. P3 TaxID=3423952 RepID=UPI003D66C05E
MLIVFQFATAQVFIVAVFVVDKQIHYSVEKDMGFRKEAVVTWFVPFDFQSPNRKKYVLRDEIRKIPGVEHVSLGGLSPAVSGRMSSGISYQEGKKELKAGCGFEVGRHCLFSYLWASAGGGEKYRCFGYGQ